MVKLFISFVATLVTLCALAVFVVSPVLAGGDMVRGDKGTGDTNQECSILVSALTAIHKPLN